MVGRRPRLLWRARAGGALLLASVLLAAPGYAQQEATEDDSYLFGDDEIVAEDETEQEVDLESEEEIADDAALGQTAPAEKTARRRQGIEEITVTGRKRDELMQEIPVSVRAFGAAEIEQRNMQRIDEIGFATANLQFTGANGSSRDTRIYIRGIGQADTRSILDPGVGMYIDNVYIPRATNALFDLVDVERIDVLRGPQGTLFGKNTVGGLVNLITAKPGRELGGNIRLNVGSFDTLETRVTVDVPITAGWFDQKLFTRWTVATATDDGYLTNIYDRGEAGDNKLLSARWASEFLPTEGVRINATFDWLRQNENAMVGRCRISGQESAVPNSDGTRLSYGPYVVARYVADNFVSQDDFASPPGYVAGQPYRFPEACAGVETLSRFEGYGNPLARLREDTYGTSLDADWQLRDSQLPRWMTASVRNVAGFRLRKEDNDPSDFDQTPVEYVELGSIPGRHYAVSDDLNANFTFDTGDPNVVVRLITGGFGFYENGHDGAYGDINRDVALGTSSDFNAETFNAASGGLIDTAFLLFGPGQYSTYSEYLKKAVRWGSGELNSQTERDWNTLSLAGYGHVELDLFEDWSITGGARYTWERKQREGSRERLLCGGFIGETTIPDPNNPGQTIPNPTAEIPGVLPQIIPPDRVCGASDPFDGVVILPQEQKYSKVSPEAGVKYRISDDQMTYFRYAQGYKSGGFNREALTENRNDFVEAAGELNTFAPETVNSYEVGFKSTWLDNQLLFNATLFWNDYRDLQLTSLEPDENGLVSANIRNAADAVTRGFELEATTIPDWDWLPLPDAQFILTTGFGYTDAYYKEYTAKVQDSPYPVLVQCTSLRRVQGPDPNDCNGEIDRFVDATLVAAIPQFGNPAPAIEVDRSDNQFANVPKLNFNVSAIYSFSPFRDTTLAANVRYYYQTEIFFNVDNSPNLYQPGYGLLDGSLALMIEATDTRIEIWGKNLTDQEYLQGGFSFGPALGADGVYVGRPRTFGMTLTQDF